MQDMSMKNEYLIVKWQLSGTPLNFDYAQFYFLYKIYINPPVPDKDKLRLWTLYFISVMSQVYWYPNIY